MTRQGISVAGLAPQPLIRLALRFRTASLRVGETEVGCSRAQYRCQRRESDGVDGPIDDSPRLNTAGDVADAAADFDDD